MKQALPPVCLLTRPRRESERLAARLARTLGLESVISPLIEIKTDTSCVSFDGYGGLILTSQQASRLLSTLKVPHKMACFAVGERTAELARAAGCDARAMGGDAERLVAEILALRPKGPLLHLRGGHSRGDVAGRLTEAGFRCDETIVYQQLDLPLTEEAQRLLSGPGSKIAPVFSPRTARLLTASKAAFKSAHLVAMSRTVAEELAPLEAKSLTIAAAPTEDAMVETVEVVANMSPSLEGGKPQG